MLKTLLIVGMLLIPSVANSTECELSLKDFIEFNKENNTKINDLSNSDIEKIFKKLRRPDIEEPYDIKLAFIDDEGSLIIIKDGCIVMFSTYISVKKFYKFLGQDNT